jgi:hypothetical protein
MSKIEDLVYSAEEHGKREALFQRVSEIRTNNPRMALDEVYERAYIDVMHT